MNFLASSHIGEALLGFDLGGKNAAGRDRTMIKNPTLVEEGFIDGKGSDLKNILTGNDGNNALIDGEKNSIYVIRQPDGLRFRWVHRSRAMLSGTPTPSNFWLALPPPCYE